MLQPPPSCRKAQGAFVRSREVLAHTVQATFIAPVGIGLALFVAELLGVYYTGGSLNPYVKALRRDGGLTHCSARSFGPSVVLAQFGQSPDRKRFTVG
jgi:glycerol uptake facilitator-like aquaporin